MKTTKDQIAVMQAFVDGKKVRFTIRHHLHVAFYVTHDHPFNFNDNTYEVIEEKSDGQLLEEAFHTVAGQIFWDAIAARFLEARAKREGGK